MKTQVIQVVLMGIFLLQPSQTVWSDESSYSEGKTLLAQLHLTETLMVYDLSAALENAYKTLQNAKKVDNPKAIWIASLDVEILEKVKRGTFSPVDLRRNLNFGMMDGMNEIPEFVFHSKQVLYVAALTLVTSKKSELALVLHDLKRAAHATGDLQLKRRFNHLEFFARQPREARSTGKATQTESFDDLITEPEDLLWPLESLLVLDALMNDENSRIRLDTAKLDEIERHVAALEKRGNRILAYNLLAAKYICLNHFKQFNQSFETCQRCIRLAEKLGSPGLIFEAQLSLSHLASKTLGAIDNADSFQSILRNPVFDSMTIAAKSNLLKYASHVSKLKGDEELASFYEMNSYPREIVNDVKLQARALEEAYGSLLDERRSADSKVDALERNHLADSQTYQQKLSRLRYYSIATTILIVALLPWLFLYFQRGRLNRIQKCLVTEQLRADQNAARCDGLTLRLNRVKRMQSLGLMAGGVAHDFNNLLVGVIGNAELIEMMGKQAGPDFVSQRVSSIRESAEKAADLARQMLAYSGKHPVARQEIGLNKLIRRNASLLKSICHPEQELAFDLSSKENVVMADSTMAERSILNLIKNASQVSPADGLINIRTGLISANDLDEESCFGESTHQADYAYIEISDHGFGISPAEREHIFEPFFTTSSSGRGLGLAVVYGFVKSHNGLVQCLSRKEGGTRFRVLLPLFSRQTPEAETVPDTDDYTKEGCESLVGLKGNGKTVLLIDDEQGVIDLCQQLFVGTGWKVISALGGNDGLAKMIQHHDQIHCVLMDIVMPDMSASEVLKEFESKKISTPVVLMSGFSKTQLESYYERPNVTAIVTKPFRNRDILAAVYYAAMFYEHEHSEIVNSTPAI